MYAQTQYWDGAIHRRIGGQRQRKDSRPRMHPNASVGQQQATGNRAGVPIRASHGLPNRRGA